MKNILHFLSELEENNHKEWMDEHRQWYLDAKEEFHAFVDGLILGISKFDPAVSGLTAKDCTFRINRDIRFSKDKRPYKNNFGAAIQEGGKKSTNPTYYVHIQPNESISAGGLYMPATEDLAKVRQEIDYNPGELKEIVENRDFRDRFGSLSGEKLKTSPKGYSKDHPNIELLRFKSFVVTRQYSDSEVISDHFRDQVLGDYKTIKPLNDYLGVAIS